MAVAERQQERMSWIATGPFRMGSEDFYPEEAPVREVAVQGFWMDEHAVTAADYRRFVRETGYVTVAERPLDPKDYPAADPELLVPGSLVFRKTAGPVPLDDHRNWWEYVPGASWRRPGGPGTTINGRDRHPVVQVAYEDAEACFLGGQGASDGGGMGIRRSRRARRSRLCLGSRALPGRKADGKHLAGRIPVAEPEYGRVRRHLACRQLFAERLWTLRRVRQRLGVDSRLVRRDPGRQAVLRTSGAGRRALPA